MHKSRWFDACWLAICIATSSAWCLTAARQLSATFDEPLYVERGLERWRTGSHAGLMKLGTMPLPIDCATLPLYVYERWTGAEIDPARELDRVLSWARATALVFWWLLLVYGWLAGRSIAGPWGGRLTAAWLACEPNLLAHATLATTDVAVSACTLALAYHFYTGRETTWWRRVGLPGVWFGAAVLAKASGLVFGPLCLLAIEVHRWWDQRRSLVKGGPRREESQIANCKLQIANCVAGSAGIGGFTIGGSLRDLIQIGLVGMAVTFAYCGCDWRAEPSFVAWARSLPEGQTHDVMVWLSERLTIFSNAGEGLIRQVKHNMRGHHGSYLLGHVYDHSLWYYFPVALTIKLALPLLIAPLALLVDFVVKRLSVRKARQANLRMPADHAGMRATCLRRAVEVILFLFRHDGACPRRALTVRLDARPQPPVSALRPPPKATDATRKGRTFWRLVLACQSALHRDKPGGGGSEQIRHCAYRSNPTNWALVAAFALFAFSLNCRVQIGIRLVLPLVAFLVVGLAGSVAIAIRRSRQDVRLLWMAFATAAVLWTAFSAWRVWPEGLCFANELWGGPADGYLCLSDSNYDWGQGLKELAVWREQHGLKHLDVWYFGADPAVNAEPFRQLPFHLLPIGQPFPLPMWIQGRYLAVSTTLLYGTSTEMPTHRAAVEFLRTREPVARTSTFLIYDVGASVAQVLEATKR